MFEGIDFTRFWEKNNEDNCGPLTPEMVAAAEKTLGRKLPASYVWLMERHNGGRLVKRHFLTNDPIWAMGYVNIEKIYGISQDAEKGIVAESWAMLHMGDYSAGVLTIGRGTSPDIVICLNYQSCGPDGEPKVFLFNWNTFEANHLADTFEDFIRGLVSDEELYFGDQEDSK